MTVTETPTSNRVFAAFAYPQYRRFFTGAMLTQTGFWFSHMSFQALMSKLTDADPLWISLLFTITFSPALFIGPFAGVLLDRTDRKRVLRVCYAVLSAVAVFQVVAVRAEIVTRVGLLGASLVAGVALSFLGPAVQSLTAGTIPLTELRSAVSLLATGNNLCRVLGPALATPLIRADHYDAAWGVFALTGFAGIVIAAPIVTRSFEPDTSDASVLTRLRSGLHHARERRPIVAALVSLSVLTILTVSHVALLPTFTSEALGRPRGDFALLNSVAGAGALFGAFGIGAFVRTVTLRGSALLAIPYTACLLAFSLVSSWPAAVAIQFVMGAFYLATFTSMQTLIQQRAAEHMRGRIMSLFNLCWSGLVPVGTLVMGLTAGGAGLGLGVRRTYTICGALALAWSVGIVVFFGRETPVDEDDPAD